MKKYINATTSYLSGSYLLDKYGELYPTVLHAPSTTYINRGLLFLSPTDAEFLHKLKKISEQDIETILLYNMQYFLDNESHSDSKFLLSSEFSNWAELKYAPAVKSIYAKIGFDDIPDDIEKPFNILNQKWYSWLQNNFTKVSIINSTVEFRITSNDGYDWNEAIIDGVVLEYDWSSSTRFNILKEDETGYKAYFYNATLDDILENDSKILSSESINPRATLKRIQSDTSIKYYLEY